MSVGDEHDDVGAWTPIGIGLFNWRMWRLMSDPARVLWLGLYASGAARRCPPGLHEGGPAGMAEATEQSVGVTVAALAELIRIGAVEHDPDLKVTRLVELPDRLLRPHNPNMVRGWWTAWRKLPRCGLTLRAVEVLAWLAADKVAEGGKTATVWSSTFGTVAPTVPATVPERFPNGSGNGSGNSPDPDHDLDLDQGSGSSSLGADETTSRAREVEPDPGLAPVLHMALAAHERHLGARSKRGGGR